MNYVKNDPDIISFRCDPCGGKMGHAHPLVNTFSNLGCSPTYFNETSDSCYWFNSHGLSLYLSWKNEIFDNLCSDFPKIMDFIFESISFNEKANTTRFSDNLLSLIREVSGIGSDDGGSVTIFLGWKSIALLILSGRSSEVSEIEVMVETRSYSVLC
ncbi:MAG: hypothetical protein Q8J68_14155 [Methanolobus sp.]|uniref:hypothetical protein n=1 Tax=Methanolobus sp. TaxID=1874737 RepID=UPI00272F1B51|nr:hypothetical protein [Methanolobus sp.]MDP2218416.1 hypothetical protein [Methanolobus sp.]